MFTLYFLADGRFSSELGRLRVGFSAEDIVLMRASRVEFTETVLSL